MARKTVSISEDAYAYLKARADDAGVSMAEAVTNLIEQQRITSMKRKANKGGDTLEPEQVDEAMGYERKPDEVTLRDGLAGLYSISRGSKDMGDDR